MPATKKPRKKSQRSKLEDRLAQDLAFRSLPVPEREYRFMTQRAFRFDFAWPAQMIAVEVQGATWVKGAHGTGLQFSRDCAKLFAAQALGWRVIVVDGLLIKEGYARRWIEYMLRSSLMAKGWLGESPLAEAIEGSVAPLLPPPVSRMRRRKVKRGRVS